MSSTREKALCNLGEDLIKCFQKYLDVTKRDNVVLTKIFMESMSTDKRDPREIAKEALCEAVEHGLKVFEISAKFLRDKMLQKVEDKDADTSRGDGISKVSGS